MRSIVGLGLRLVLDGLKEVDVDTVTPAYLQELLSELNPALGRLSGAQTRLVGALQERSGGSVPGPEAADGTPGSPVLVRHWLRDLTNSGGSAAASQVRLAGALRQLPLLDQAVLDGVVQPEQARIVTRLVGQIDPTALTEAEPALIQVAADRDPVSLAEYVRHLLASWCEPQIDADARSQENKRYLQTRREDDGMLSGRFRLTAEDSEPFLTLIEPLARPAGLADPRDAGQRRADALVDAIGLALQAADLPDAGGHRPHVSYVVPAGWAAADRTTGSFADLVSASLPRPCSTRDDRGALAGAVAGAPADLGAAPGGSADVFGDDLFGAPLASPVQPVPVEHRVATGAWSGPQTRARIESVLCDARISRVLLTERGQVRGLEALRDTITKTQRRALAARDHGCAARGCTRPPAFCDAHHLVHREDGGPTTLDNLVLLCRRHHVLWHQGRLTLRQLHVPWIDVTADPPVF